MCTCSWEDVSLSLASDAEGLVRAATLMGRNGLVQQLCITPDSVFKVSADTLEMSTPWKCRCEVFVYIASKDEYYGQAKTR